MIQNEIYSIEKAEKSIQEIQALVLYFYSDRCAPCVSLRPKVAQLLEDQYSKIKMLFIDSEKHPDIAARFNSFSNPTLIVFFDGREFRRFSKYISIQQLSEEIRKPYSLLFDEA